MDMAGLGGGIVTVSKLIRILYVACTDKSPPAGAMVDSEVPEYQLSIPEVMEAHNWVRTS